MLVLEYKKPVKKKLNSKKKCHKLKENNTFPYVNLFQNKLMNSVHLYFLMEYLLKRTLYKNIYLSFFGALCFVILKLRKTHYLGKVPLESNDN